MLGMLVSLDSFVAQVACSLILLSWPLLSLLKHVLEARDADKVPKGAAVHRSGRTRMRGRSLSDWDN